MNSEYGFAIALNCNKLPRLQEILSWRAFMWDLSRRRYCKRSRFRSRANLHGCVHLQTPRFSPKHFGIKLGRLWPANDALTLTQLIRATLCSEPSKEITATTNFSLQSLHTLCYTRPSVRQSIQSHQPRSFNKTAGLSASFSTLLFTTSLFRAV